MSSKKLIPLTLALGLSLALSPLAIAGSKHATKSGSNGQGVGNQGSQIENHQHQKNNMKKHQKQKTLRHREQKLSRNKIND